MGAVGENLMKFPRTPQEWLIFVHSALQQIGEFLQPLVLLLFRLHWGWQFYLSGKGKLVNHERTTAFFAALGIPAPELNAWFVGGLECFGGILLLAGFMSRPVAFMLTINMLVAYMSVSADQEALLGMFTNPAAFVDAEPFFFLLLAVLILAFGPGRISVDAMCKRRWGYLLVPLPAPKDSWS